MPDCGPRKTRPDDGEGGWPLAMPSRLDLMHRRPENPETGRGHLRRKVRMEPEAGARGPLLGHARYFLRIW